MNQYAHVLPSGPVSPPSGKAMWEFIDAVHQSLELDQVGTNYMATITSLVRANAYGFYLFHSLGQDLVRVAVYGGVDRYVRRYEQYGYHYDPLLRYLVHEQQPVYETQPQG